MDTLDNIRSSFLNKNGFKVGFSNRSPLKRNEKINQYTIPTADSFSLPKLDGAKVGKHISDGAQSISNAKIKGSEVINQSIMGATEEIAKAIEAKKENKKQPDIDQTNSEDEDEFDDMLDYNL